RALAGSVADEVIREAGVAVLMLRQPDEEAAVAMAPRDFKKILVLDDGSPSSSEIIDSAVAVSTRGSSQFVLLQVVQPVRPIPDPSLPYGYLSGPADGDATTAFVVEARAHVDRLAKTIAERSGCDVDPRVMVDAHPATAIVDFAKRHDVDLIAMTTRGRGASRLVFGSVTDAVLRSANLP